MKENRDLLVDGLRIGIRLARAGQVRLAVLGKLLAVHDVRARVVVLALGRQLAVTDANLDAKLGGAVEKSLRRLGEILFPTTHLDAYLGVLTGSNVTLLVVRVELLGRLVEPDNTREESSQSNLAV